MSPTDIALVPSLWGIAGTYSLLGLLLLLAGTRQKKAPGIHMPRA
jgi:hypothetical protein